MASFCSLSPAQADALLHRLEVGDAIAEVLIDSGETALHDEIWEQTQILERRVRETRRVTFDNELQRLILAEAVNGSTYVACAISDYQTPLAIARAVRTVEALERKISELIGETVVCPVN
jgi:hypothetical protein